MAPATSQPNNERGAFRSAQGGLNARVIGIARIILAVEAVVGP